ncbi:hypothetical protein ACWFMI_27385 [Nocardiopsis terrae]
MTVTAEHPTTTDTATLTLTGSAGHLADQIGWVASHRVRMIVAAPNRGVVITPHNTDQEAEDAWFLVMPVRRGGRDL